MEPYPTEPDADFYATAAPAISSLREMGQQFSRLMLEYEFAIKEVMTKVEILQQEFIHEYKYNPIEHISSRVKSRDSLMKKLARKGYDISTDVVESNIHDVAGVRVTCSFIKDTYRVMQALTGQDDIEVIEIKDYIENPKSNGYKSLHVIVKIPVFLSSGPKKIPVEIQFRTIAMDFWAALEHKIFYKYDREVPAHLVEELTETAMIADMLDRRMERLHISVHGDSFGPRDGAEEDQESVELLHKLFADTLQQDSQD